MPGKTFIDSNVAIYVYSEDEAEKKRLAESLLRGGARPWINSQVLSELASVLRRKFKLDYPDIAAAVAEVRAACAPQHHHAAKRRPGVVNRRRPDRRQSRPDFPEPSR